MNLMQIEALPIPKNGAEMQDPFVLSSKAGLTPTQIGKRREWWFHFDHGMLFGGFAATVALLIDDANWAYVGVSLCSSKDKLNRKLGRYVALYRARRSMCQMADFHPVRAPADLTPRGLRALAYGLASQCAFQHWPIGKRKQVDSPADRIFQQNQALIQKITSDPPDGPAPWMPQYDGDPNEDSM